MTRHYSLRELSDRIGNTPGCIVFALNGVSGVQLLIDDKRFDVADLKAYCERMDRPYAEVEAFLTEGAEVALADGLGVEVAEILFQELRS